MALRPRLLLGMPVAALAGLLLATTAPASGTPAAPGSAAPSPAASRHIGKHGVRHHAKPTPLAQPIAPLGPSVAPAQTAAPLPNQDVTAPPDWHASEPSFEPRIMQLQYPTVGNGYLPGSSPSAIDNEHAPKVGGVELKVPLQP